LDQPQRELEQSFKWWKSTCR